MINATFGHVNVIARDWRSLARFCTEVFGCEFVPPERDISGPALETYLTDPEGNIVELQSWSDTAP